MITLAAVGLGYCARHFVTTRRSALGTVLGTARRAESLERFPPGVDGVVFDGAQLSPQLAVRLADQDVLIASVPPEAEGDPLLRLAGPTLARGRVSQIIYLSTLGVYGDQDGGWVDETAPPRGESARLQRRLEAEAAWFTFGAAYGKAVAALRLAGIYGPGRNALAQLRSGEARIIDKPGQVFNRVHVEDISRAVEAVIAHRFAGVLNVADDEPTAPGVPVAFAAELLGLSPPVAVPFEEAAKTMSPMALSFWGASKRVSNRRLRHELGVELAYPSYREGLRALAAAGEGQGKGGRPTAAGT